MYVTTFDFISKRRWEKTKNNTSQQRIPIRMGNGTTWNNISGCLIASKCCKGQVHIVSSGDSSVSEPSAPGQCKEPRVSGGITPGGGEFILGSCEQEVPRWICRDRIRSVCRNTSAALGTFQEWMFGQERATEVWNQSEACMQLSCFHLWVRLK